MVRAWVFGILAIASQPTKPVEAEPAPIAAASDMPIAVTASKDDGEAGQSSAIVGSRIARKPVLEAGAVASNTPIGALSATSGVDPLSAQNRTIKRKTSTCRSDDPVIGKAAACLLLDAQTALQRDDGATAIALYRSLNSSDQFSSAERLVAAERMFALGQTSSDADLREEALIRMLATSAMPFVAAQSARRSLVTFALERADVALAITRLREVVAQDASDAQSLANLAILLRQENLAGASEHMMQAIQIRTSRGETIPKGWTDFVRGG
jgi:hypothetical protein